MVAKLPDIARPADGRRREIGKLVASGLMGLCEIGLDQDIRLGDLEARHLEIDVEFRQLDQFAREFDFVPFSLFRNPVVEDPEDSELLRAQMRHPDTGDMREAENAGGLKPSHAGDDATLGVYHQRDKEAISLDGLGKLLDLLLLVPLQGTVRQLDLVKWQQLHTLRHPNIRCRIVATGVSIGRAGAPTGTKVVFVIHLSISFRYCLVGSWCSEQAARFTSGPEEVSSHDRHGQSS